MYITKFQKNSLPPGKEPREYEVHLHPSWPTMLVEWVAILEDKVLATSDVKVILRLTGTRLHKMKRYYDYHIAGNFRGRKLSQIGEKYDFHEENCLPCQRMLRHPNSWRKLSQIATKPQNSRECFLLWKFLAIWCVSQLPFGSHNSTTKMLQNALWTFYAQTASPSHSTFWHFCQYRELAGGLRLHSTTAVWTCGSQLC